MPFAVVTGPEVPPPCGGVFCHRTWPGTASTTLHTPLVVVVPLGSVHGTKLLLALAVYTRLPSTAEPHWSPPAVPPGPAWVNHCTAPVSGSTAQYWPLFWPAPTISRGAPVPVGFTVNSAAA